MVDINLFKDDEDEKGEWQPTSGGEGELEDELREETLGAEGDFSGPSPLDEEGLLGSEDEVIPEFGEHEEGEQEEDYEFGGGREKKTPLWLWAFLGLVLIGAVIYLFIIQPRQKKQGEELLSSRTQLTADSLSSVRRLGAVGTVRKDSSAAARKDSSISRPAVEGVSASMYVEAAGAVLENLSRQGQLGTIVVERDQFHVGYVSETPNVAQAMGHRIQTLLGASSFKVSPEDRHTTGGRIRYWGVVSGTLPKKASGVVETTGERFETEQSFIDGMKGRIQQHGLSIQQTEKFSVQSVGGIRQIPIRMKVEGSKNQVASFFNGMKKYRGNYGLNKITIAPANISDFFANRVIVMLDFFFVVS